MQNDIWAIFKHMIQDYTISMAEQQANSPKYGWYKYWANNSSYYPSKSLSLAFVDALKPIFMRLTNADSLQRCLGGFIQSQNESLNGTVWKQCLKTHFCSQQCVQIAVFEAVCKFNAGSVSVIELPRVQSYQETHTGHCSKRTKGNYMKQCIKILLKAWLIWRKNRAKKKAANESVKCVYLAGGYGVKRNKQTNKKTHFVPALKI